MDIKSNCSVLSLYQRAKPNSTKAHGFKSNCWNQIYLLRRVILIQMLRQLIQ